LKSAEANTAVAGILPREKRAQEESADKDYAGYDDPRAGPAADQNQNQWQGEIELVLDRERPCVRERGAAMQINVLDGNQEFPQRRDLRKLAQRRQTKVNREHDKVSGHDPQRASRKESRQIDGLIARQRREQLTTDQVTAEHEEKIDTDPAESMPVIRQCEAENATVVNDHHDDGERAEKIETRLAFAINETRIDCSFGCGLVNVGT